VSAGLWATSHQVTRCPPLIEPATEIIIGQVSACNNSAVILVAIITLTTPPLLFNWLMPQR
jgi:hypothetical protein